MRKFYAHLKIKQDIKRAKLCQDAAVLERAKKMCLANKFATELSSLVLDLGTAGIFRSGQPAVGSGGSGNGPAGVCSPISPGENSADSSPCQITLYTEESYQGDSLTFSASMPDLSVWDFKEKLGSVKVEGACQWKLFAGGNLTPLLISSFVLCSERSYAGTSLEATSNEGDVYRGFGKALSVKKL